MRLFPLFLVAACYEGPDVHLVDEVPIVGNDACAPARDVRVGCTLDGDTFDISGCGGDFERIRMLGIDAPEIAHGDDPADCWGPEAGNELARLIDGREVTLTFDEECVGVFGRTLAYVWLSTADVDIDPTDTVSTQDGAVLVNELMLSRGYARLYDEDWVAELRLQERLAAAEATAAARGIGLWAACEP